MKYSKLKLFVITPHLSESGQKNDKISRDVLATKFGVMDDAKTCKIPLLYYIVAAFQNVDEEE